MKTPQSLPIYLLACIFAISCRKGAKLVRKSSEQDGLLPIEIDLSKDAGNLITESVPSNTNLKITIINLVPNPLYTYTILFEVKNEPVQAFSIEGISRDTTPFPENLGEPSICSETLVPRYNEAYNALNMAEEENHIQQGIHDLRNAITRLDSNKCDYPSNRPKEKALALIKATERISDRVFKLRSGERLEVKIIRSKKDGGQSRNWKYIFTTGSRGEWRTNYGFSFIPNVISKEELFFAASKDSVFVITKEENRKWMDFVPSVFFSWMPRHKENEYLAWSVTGGFGFDLDNPVAFFGGAVHFNQNLGLMFGVTAHKQKVLLGMYKENLEIKENLSSAQLHEELYRINPFIALAFRFGSNPFLRDNQ